jgi:hypothetical protein
VQNQVQATNEFAFYNEPQTCRSTWASQADYDAKRQKQRQELVSCAGGGTEVLLNLIDSVFCHQPSRLRQTSE